MCSRTDILQIKNHMFLKWHQTKAQWHVPEVTSDKEPMTCSWSDIWRRLNHMFLKWHQTKAQWHVPEVTSDKGPPLATSPQSTHQQPLLPTLQATSLQGIVEEHHSAVSVSTKKVPTKKKYIRKITF